MAQDIEIANAQYNDVPSIEVPKQGGGTASFVDTTDADAVASEIDMGKTAYVNGVKLTGTRSGGGGGFDPITQDGDTITVPSGHIDAEMQQINLNLPDKTLVLK